MVRLGRDLSGWLGASPLLRITHGQTLAVKLILLITLLVGNLNKRLNLRILSCLVLQMGEIIARTLEL